MAPDLLDVLERLAAPGVAARQRAHQREVALDQLLARGRVALLVVAAEERAVLLAGLLRRCRRAPLRDAHERPLSFSSRTTMAPSPRVLDAERVHHGLKDAPQRELAGRHVAVAKRLGDRALGERPHARADARLAHLEGQLDAADLARLGEQPLDRELEVVDLLEREVHALGDAADDQAYDSVEVARQRRFEVDAFVLVDQRGSPMVPSPTTRS